MPLPHANITGIPNNEPDATPSLWNSRYSEIDSNFNYLETKANTLTQGINRVINGDFAIWQRGVSKTFTNGQFSYLADRFFMVNKSNGQFTSTKSVLNGSYSIRTTINVPCTLFDLSHFIHPIVYIFDGNHLYDLIINKKKVTISFDFISNVVGTFSATLRNSLDQAGKYNHTSYDSYVHSFSYTTPNVVQRITYTIQMPNAMNGGVFNDAFGGGILLAIGGINKGDHETAQLDQWISGNFISAAGTVNWAANVGNYIDVTKIQVEEGGTATKYEYVQNDIQLLRCSRYYEAFTLHYTSDNLAAVTGATVYFKAVKVRPATITMVTANTGSGVTIPYTVDNSANGMREFFIYNKAPVGGTNNSFHFFGYAESELFHIY